MFTIDAHLDLSMNAMEWNRDLRLPVAQINAREKASGLKDKPDRGNATVSLPELRTSGIGLVVATQIARYVASDNPLPGWHSPEQAWAQTQAQFQWYAAMEEAGEMVQITNLPSLESHSALWTQATEQHTDLSRLPVGFILSLEGGDSLVTLHHLERAYGYGLRAVGPAHYGPGRYAYGTDATAPLGQAGRELLVEMDRLGMILDATHLCDECLVGIGDFSGARLGQPQQLPRIGQPQPAILRRNDQGARRSRRGDRRSARCVDDGARVGARQDSARRHTLHTRSNDRSL